MGTNKWLSTHKGEGMSELSKKKCEACEKGTPPLSGLELNELYLKLGNSWELIDEHHIEKKYTFKNFSEALAFVNKVGQIAEEQAHHPDIELSWGKAKLTLFTHKIDGLSESDFIFAAKCDEI